MTEFTTIFSNFTRADWIQVFVGSGAWFAGLSAFVAIFVSLSLSRRGEYLNSKSLLQFTHNFLKKDSHLDYIGYGMTNLGSGNAYILPMHFFIDDQYLGTNQEKDTGTFDEFLPHYVRFMTIRSTVVIPAGETYKVIFLPPGYYDDLQANQVIDNLKKIRMIIPYYENFGGIKFASVGSWDSYSHYQKEISSHNIKSNSRKLMKINRRLLAH